jgi:Cu/Ag efflux protein CusF
MKNQSIPLLLVTVFACSALVRAEESCTCGTHLADTAVSADSKDASKRHPLKGVVIDVLTDRSALLVKHEEIPGVMRAMTMLLKVDADTLKSPAATQGAAITGLLVRKTDGWWLEAVKSAE